MKYIHIVHFKLGFFLFFLGKVGKINLIRLSRVILEEISTRKLPRKYDPNFPPAVLMKLDTEGSEVDIVPDLIVTGALSRVNLSMIEWHARLASSPARKKISDQLQNFVNLLSSLTKAFKIKRLDDESYHLSNFKLPTCLGRKIYK